MSTSIPHVIHQIWVQGAEALPLRYRATTRTWKKRNPGWQYTLWDDRSLRDLLGRRAPEWLRLYVVQPEMEARADVGRYALLDLFGGLYADTDTECRRPVGPLLDASVARLHLAAYANPRNPPDPIAHATNSIIASSAGHPIWPLARERIAGNDLAMWVTSRTGPDLLRPILRQHIALHPDDVHLLAFPYNITTFLTPKFYMRRFSRRRPENCILDFNDSARRGARRDVKGLSAHVRHLVRQLRAYRI